MEGTDELDRFATQILELSLNGAELYSLGGKTAEVRLTLSNSQHTPQELDLMEGELEWIGYEYEYRTRSIVDHEHKGEKEEKSDVYHKVFNDKGGNRRERVLVVSVMEDFEEGRLLCLLDEALRD